MSDTKQLSDNKINKIEIKVMQYLGVEYPGIRGNDIMRLGEFMMGDVVAQGYNHDIGIMFLNDLTDFINNEYIKLDKVIDNEHE